MVIDISKYNIDNYPKFVPTKIKPNSVINILGPRLSGKKTLEIDLIYKIMAHRNIIICYIGGSQWEKQEFKKMKKDTIEFCLYVSFTRI